MSQLTLKKNTNTFISFTAKKYVSLAKRGYFDTEDHCMENIEISDTISCFKKCYIERAKVRNTKCRDTTNTHTFQIDCQPDILNVFDEVNLPTCNLNKTTEVFGKFSKYSEFENFCNKCLTPCQRIDYDFQVIMQFCKTALFIFSFRLRIKNQIMELLLGLMLKNFG